MNEVYRSYSASGFGFDALVSTTDLLDTLLLNAAIRVDFERRATQVLRGINLTHEMGSRGWRLSEICLH